MTEERISELRAICAEYERNKSIDEALGHGDQAADIAADGVGRKALEALPELLNALEWCMTYIASGYGLPKNVQLSYIEMSILGRKFIAPNITPLIGDEHGQS